MAGTSWAMPFRSRAPRLLQLEAYGQYQLGSAIGAGLRVFSGWRLLASTSWAVPFGAGLLVLPCRVLLGLGPRPAQLGFVQVSMVLKNLM